MSNVPTPEYDPFEGNPVIAEAVATLRAFGGNDLSQEAAVPLLYMWQYNSRLTLRERVAILERFTPENCADVSAIDDVLTTLADKAFEHAFTVGFDPDAQLFVWLCRCGWQHAQALDERDVRTALIMHLEGGQVYPPIADYRKRLDAWSKDQQIEADQRDRESGQ